MLHPFKEIRVLRDEGRIHARLLFRTRLLMFVAAILAAAVVYNVIFRDASPWFALAFAAVGFVPGLLVFSRMNALKWNEEDSVVQSGRMTAIGFAILGLYVAFEVGLHVVAGDVYPVAPTVVILAAVCGSLAGRSLGTLIEIHNVYLNRGTRPE